MIPVASVIATAAGIALGTPASSGGTDSQWGSPTDNAAHTVGVPAISPGAHTQDPTLHRAWKQLVIENQTDVRLDIGILTTPGVITTTAAANSEVKTTILSLAVGSTVSWDFSPDRLAGPIFLRGTTADPTVGNAYLSGMVE